MPPLISIFYAKEGVSRLSVQNLLTHSTKKFRCGTIRCIRKFRLLQYFMHKKGISVNSVEKSLSHSADKIRRRTLLCFERILLSKIFKERRGKLHGFVEIFVSQDRNENLCKGNLLFSMKFLVSKKIYA